MSEETGYDRHFFPKGMLTRMADPYPYDLDIVRANATQEPAPGSVDYSAGSTAVAVVRRVDEVRIKADQWAAQTKSTPHPLDASIDGQPRAVREDEVG